MHAESSLTSAAAASLFAALLATMAAGNAVADEQLTVARYDGRLHESWVVNRDGGTVPLRDSNRSAPLGSLWKLFVFAYLAEQQLTPVPYSCRGKNTEEVFCCDPGRQIDMDQALARSCGPYFAPQRVGIRSDKWREFWQRQAGQSFGWLIDVERLTPDRNVRVEELLVALHAINRGAFALPALRSALGNVLLDGTAAGEVRHLGTTVRAKTYSWRTGKSGDYVGGFAGWLNDGSVVWVSGRGTGAMVIRQWHAVLAPLLAKPLSDPSNDCVSVRYFERYPVRDLHERLSGLPASDGGLTGSYTVSFVNGNRLEFHTSGGLRVARADGKVRITGTFTLNDYVARVIDREGDADAAEEAVKALAVAARSYLVQNAGRRDGCYEIGDSTRYQRVAIGDPTVTARQFSYWTDSLVVSGAEVYYHRDKAAPGTMSWKQAERLAADGFRFDEILRSAFPAGRLAVIDARHHTACVREPVLESWLSQRVQQWAPRLVRYRGYEPPSEVRVCRLDAGSPYADVAGNRIFASGASTVEERITLAHEYLHLAFKNHPFGSDNSFAERLAQELIAGEGGEHGHY